MYHRFEENKYPSTNIKIDDFKKQLNLIKESKIKFISYKDFENYSKIKNLERKFYLQ